MNDKHNIPHEFRFNHKLFDPMYLLSVLGFGISFLTVPFPWPDKLMLILRVASVATLLITLLQHIFSVLIVHVDSLEMAQLIMGRKIWSTRIHINTFELKKENSKFVFRWLTGKKQPWSNIDPKHFVNGDELGVVLQNNFIKSKE